jgi:monovalent cation:proton antiporter-2 (CPA2) family protein
MNIDTILLALLIILASTLICVTFFERVGLGAVVGFIFAGILVGPHTPGLVATEQVATLQDISQLGVVLFLFVVGLEMLPTQLWSLRRQIFGVGLLQVLLTALPLAVMLIYGFDLGWRSATILSLGLAMSSTAVVMTILAGRNQLSTPYGRLSFSVLTAQDLSIVPVMALVPVLAHHAAEQPQGSAWTKAAFAAAALAAVFVVGRYLLPAVLGWAVRSRNSETFTVAMFLSLLGAAWCMDQVSISMTLGAFLLGILLSASDYRYQIMATVEPFKGVLMGLFFIAVGMSIDVGALVDGWSDVLILIAAVMIIKIVVLLALCLAFSSGTATSIRTAFSLSQVGEFAFVLFSVSAAAGLASPRAVTIGFLTIAGSMILTPLVIRLGDRLAARYDKGHEFAPGSYADDMSRHLVIIGLDDIGHLIALMAERTAVPYIAFDYEYQTVMHGKRAGRKVYFGDIHSRVVQEAAGLARATAVFISSTDMESLKSIALTLRQNYPDLDIFARVDSIQDQQELRALGIKHAATSFIESTLSRGTSLLREMGVAEDAVDSLVESLRKDEYAPIIEALGMETRTAHRGAG